MSNTVERLTALEMISQDDFEDFEALRRTLKKKRKKRELRLKLR